MELANSDCLRAPVTMTSSNFGGGTKLAALGGAAKFGGGAPAERSLIGAASCATLTRSSRLNPPGSAS